MYMFCIRVHIYNFCLLKPQTYCINSDIYYTLDLEFSGIHFFSFANTSCTSKITKQTFIYLLFIY